MGLSLMAQGLVFLCLGGQDALPNWGRDGHRFAISDLILVQGLGHFHHRVSRLLSGTERDKAKRS